MASTGSSRHCRSFRWWRRPEFGQSVPIMMFVSRETNTTQQQPHESSRTIFPGRGFRSERRSPPRPIRNTSETGLNRRSAARFMLGKPDSLASAGDIHWASPGRPLVRFSAAPSSPVWPQGPSRRWDIAPRRAQHRSSCVKKDPHLSDFNETLKSSVSHHRAFRPRCEAAHAMR